MAINFLRVPTAGVDSLVVENVTTEVAGRAPSKFYHPEIRWDEIARFYEEKGLKLDAKSKEWKERVATIRNFSESFATGEPPVIQWLTSYDVIALRKGIIGAGLAPNLAFAGLVVTSDNYIVSGVRGGEVTPERVKLFGSGMYGLPVTGAMTWGEDAESLVSNVLSNELYEELGLGMDSVHSVEPLGVFQVREDSFPGIKIAARIVLNVNFAEVVQSHKTASEAWEHTSIEALKNNAIAVRSALSEGNYISTSRGALELHLNSL